MLPRATRPPTRPRSGPGGFAVFVAVMVLVVGAVVWMRAGFLHAASGNPTTSGPSSGGSGGTGNGGSPSGSNPSASVLTAPGEPGNPIKHVIFILKENRSFDNYFGKYPGADGATEALMSDGTKVPLAKAHNTVGHDICHDFISGLKSIDGG